MKIGLVQYRFLNGDIEYNLLKVQNAMKEYSGKADLLCFGESFLQGFDSLLWDFEKDKETAIPSDSEYMERICQWSTKYKVSVLFGYFERDEDRIYSSCAIVGDGKLIYNYRRVSQGWKEFSKTDAHYMEGNETGEFSVKGKEFGLALCGDLWSEGWERFKTDKPLLWPVYVSFSLEEWEREEQEYALRAFEVSKDVLMINSLSKEPSLSHGGTFHFSNGKTAERLLFDEEDVLIVEI